jgi:hypothetical protein
MSNVSPAKTVSATKQLFVEMPFFLSGIVCGIASGVLMCIVLLLFLAPIITFISNIIHA